MELNFDDYPRSGRTGLYNPLIVVDIDTRYIYKYAKLSIATACYLESKHINNEFKTLFKYYQNTYFDFVDIPITDSALNDDIFIVDFVKRIYMRAALLMQTDIFFMDVSDAIEYYKTNKNIFIAINNFGI